MGCRWAWVKLQVSTEPGHEFESDFVATKNGVGVVDANMPATNAILVSL